MGQLQAIMMAVEPFAPLLSNSATFNRKIPTLLHGYLVSLMLSRLLEPATPGPTIIAITSLYAMYHDIVRGVQYIWVVYERHKRYG